MVIRNESLGYEKFLGGIDLRERRNEDDNGEM
jgi:hypothetical protein